MQLYQLESLSLPALPENTRVAQDLIPQLTKQKNLYTIDIPESKKEVVNNLLNFLALHIAYSRKHPEKYKKNTLYFIWFLFVDESKAKEFYIPEINDFSSYFTSGETKKKTDSNPQLLLFLREFYKNNKTLSKQEKLAINLFSDGHTTNAISTILKIDRVKVTTTITALTKRALQYLDLFYESNKENINQELEELSSLVWDEEV